MTTNQTTTLTTLTLERTRAAMKELNDCPHSMDQSCSTLLLEIMYV